MTSEPRTRAVVDGLVAAGLLDADRRAAAEPVVRSALGEDTTAPTLSGSLRRRMAEVAGYVGGAFVVGAALLFLGATWDDLGLGEQVGVLVGIAVLLVAAGAALATSAGGPTGIRQDAEAVRRRLASVLFTGAAGSAAFGAGLLLEDGIANDELGVALAALTGLLVALAGYLVAPTTVGQLGVVVPALVAIPMGLASLHTDSTSTVPVGLLVLLLGVAWLALAELGRWNEVLSARVIGCTVALVGAQIPVFDDQQWVAYVATAVVGAVSFWVYVVTRAWPYLAAGVVGVTLAVPEALSDWFDGALGAAGVLLATGVTLLLAALAGLRLRQEVTG